MSKETTTTIKIKTSLDLAEAETKLKGLLDEIKKIEKRNDLEKNVKTLEKKIGKLNQEIDKTEIEGYQAEITKHKEKIKELTKELAPNDEDIKNKKVEINNIRRAKEEAPSNIGAEIIEPQLKDLNKQLDDKQNKLKEAAEAEKKIKEDALRNKTELLKEYKKATDNNHAEQIDSKTKLENTKTEIEIKAEQDKQTKIKQDHAEYILGQIQLEDIKTEIAVKAEQDKQTKIKQDHAEQIDSKTKLENTKTEIEIKAEQDKQTKIKQDQAEYILGQIQLEDIKTEIAVKAEQDKQAKIKTEIEAFNKQKATLLNQNLTDTQYNIFEKYKLREAGFKAELAAHEGKFEKINEIEKRRKKAHKEHYDELTKDVTKYLSKAKEGYTAFSDMIFAFAEWEIAEDQDNHERKLANMESEKKTTAEIEAEKVKLKAERDAKTLKAKRAKADRDKYFAVFETSINTASAIVKMLADPGGFPGIAMSIAAGITGVAQIAKIVATPLPKVARGGLIGGKPHSLGGTLIEAEAGEAIINRRSTGMFAPLLSAINESGGGVPFASPLSDGGFAHREYQRRNQSGINEAQMEQAMSRAFANQQIYVAIEDINKGQQQYVQTTDISTF